MRSRRKLGVEPECPQNGGRKESGFWNGCTRNNQEANTNWNEELQRAEFVLLMEGNVARRK
jgi:hypothetical protein